MNKFWITLFTVAMLTPQLSFARTFACESISRLSPSLFDTLKNKFDIPKDDNNEKFKDLRYGYEQAAIRLCEKAAKTQCNSDHLMVLKKIQEKSIKKAKQGFLSSTNRNRSEALGTYLAFLHTINLYEKNCEAEKEILTDPETDTPNK